MLFIFFLLPNLVLLTSSLKEQPIPRILNKLGPILKTSGPFGLDTFKAVFNNHHLKMLEIGIIFR